MFKEYLGGRICRICLHLEDEGNDRVRHNFWFLAWMTVWVVVAILETRNTEEEQAWKEYGFSGGHVAFVISRRK